MKTFPKNSRRMFPLLLMRWVKCTSRFLLLLMGKINKDQRSQSHGMVEAGKNLTTQLQLALSWCAALVHSKSHHATIASNSLINFLG